jgi:hypothetical protein
MEMYFEVILLGNVGRDEAWRKALSPGSGPNKGSGLMVRDAPKGALLTMRVIRPHPEGARRPVSKEGIALRAARSTPAF